MAAEPMDMDIDVDLNAYANYMKLPSPPQPPQPPLQVHAPQPPQLEFAHFRSAMKIANIYDSKQGLAFYRCGKNNPKDAVEPRFFSQRDVVVKKYKKIDNKLYECVPDGDIHLADIRILRHIAMDMLMDMQDKEPNVFENYKLKNGRRAACEPQGNFHKEIDTRERADLSMISKHEIECFMASFGLYGHAKQIEFASNAYVNYNEINKSGTPKKCPYNSAMLTEIPIPRLEHFGSRMSFSIVDEKAVRMLAKLFNNSILHGYIAPKMPSPWHKKWNSTDPFFIQELCLFNPRGSNFTSIDTPDKRIGGKMKGKRIRKNIYGGVGEENASKEDEEDDIERVTASKKDNIDDKWLELERLIEHPSTGYEFQCALSNNSVLRGFMANILVKLTNILYDALVVEHFTKKIKKIRNNDDSKHRAEYDEQISQHLQRTSGTLLMSAVQSIKFNYDATTKEDQPNEKTYILKPGMAGLTSNNVIEDILNGKILKDSSNQTSNSTGKTAKRQRNYLKDYSLSEIMGAIYGIVTHNGMFALIMKAHFHRHFHKKYIFIGKRVHAINNTLRTLFNLPTKFDERKLIALLEGVDVLRTNEKEEIAEVVKGGPLGVFLDMMIYNPFVNNHSIVRRNITNQEYIRTRRQKGTSYESFSKTRPAPVCPVFGIKYKSDVVREYKSMLVDGDEWYTVSPTNMFSKMLKEYGRTVKAGPSGSTFMWMNLVFDLINMKKSRSNYELLLFCIIADFVPVYHSLTEVLIVYSQECEFVRSPFTLDQNPIQWLSKQLVRDREGKKSQSKECTEDTLQCCIHRNVSVPSIKTFIDFIDTTYRVDSIIP